MNDSAALLSAAAASCIAPGSATFNAVAQALHPSGAADDRVAATGGHGGPDAYRTPRLPDSDRVWLSLGGQSTINNQLKLDAGLASIISQRRHRQER